MTTPFHGRPSIVATLAAAIAIGASLSTPVPAGARGVASFTVFEGTVVTVGGTEAEGGFEVVAVRLDVEGDVHEVLLGPADVLAGEGFVIDRGDRLRVRVFVDEDEADGPRVAQRVLNLSDRTMVRLRTLHRTPLWGEVVPGGDPRRPDAPRSGPERSGNRPNGAGDRPR